jgi:hypothetical protein
MKFVGAGQGPKALTAELIAGAIGQHLGLDIPEIVLLQLDPRLGRSEPNPEIQDLLRASAGINLGFRFLPAAFAYNALLRPQPSPELASRIVWFDAYVTNVDRTPRNVNMLLAESRLWLIDHGAALYFHHSWDDIDGRSRSSFPLIREHTLIQWASMLDDVDQNTVPQITDDLIRSVVQLPPSQWLIPEARLHSPDEQRALYYRFLTQRRDASTLFVQEAKRAHAQHL